MDGTLKKNLKNINTIIAQELEQNSSLELPRVIAVSKKQPANKIHQLFDLGIFDFGENYLQEALDKMELLKDLNICWHFIGNIQTKKIKNLVGNITANLIAPVEIIARKT